MKSSDPDTFWARVDRRGGPEACWPWTGKTNAKGYAYLRWVVDGAVVLWGVHRIASFIELGRDPLTPATPMLRHSCDARSCCNPGHHVPGTAAQNSADMVARERSITGEDHHWSVLSEEDVIEIDALLKSGVKRGEIATAFNVHKGTIGYIARGETWRRLLRAA